ncbi:MAG: transglutaminase-like domain-containing protein [Betaproteobacteria bacterium]
MAAPARCLAEQDLAAQFVHADPVPGALMVSKAARAASAGLLCLAIVLISSNVAGLITSLRNDEIFSEKNVLFPDDITLTARQVHDVIAAPAADRKSYAMAVSHAINKGVAHYLWLDEGIEKYNLRVPFHENYILFVASYLIPQYYRKYEFRDYRRAIERGVGLCSQHAIIVAEILRKKGLASGIVSMPTHADMPGHVVATARVDDARNEWWILDADYGVVVPHGIEAVRAQPSIVAPYYRRRGYDEQTVATLVSNYAKDARVFPDGAKNYGVMTYWAEAIAYALIWIIPGFLAIPFVLTLRSGKQPLRHRKYRCCAAVIPAVILID